MLGRRTKLKLGSSSAALPMAINLFEGLGSGPWIPGPNSFIKPRVLKAAGDDPVDLTRCILTKHNQEGKLLSDWTMPTRCLVPLAPSMGAQERRIPRQVNFHCLGYQCGMLGLLRGMAVILDALLNEGLGSNLKGHCLLTPWPWWPCINHIATADRVGDVSGKRKPATSQADGMKSMGAFAIRGFKVFTYLSE